MSASLESQALRASVLQRRRQSVLRKITRVDHQIARTVKHLKRLEAQMAEMAPNERKAA